MKPLVLVVAVAENGVIGRKGHLPWRIPGDLKHFKAVTMGKPVVMGRRTFEAIGHALNGRSNIVLTRNTSWNHPSVLVAHNFEKALKLATSEANRLGSDEITLIGGRNPFLKALPLASRIEMTEVHADVLGDVTFPTLDRTEWRETQRRGPLKGRKDEYSYSLVTLEKVSRI